MLGSLTEKFQGVFSKLRGQKKLTEANISDAVRQVRLALLEADVNYGVAKTLIQRIKEKALGDTVLKSVTPGQQFIKVVHEELIELMGGKEEPISLEKRPTIVMLCGLQGSGKTTFSVKLCHYLKKQKLVKTPLLAACDLQRPAAIEQLSTLAKQVDVPVCKIANESDPLKVAKLALNQAEKEQHDLLIIDTAGRLHIDEELMTQLSQLEKFLKPDEIFFVANAATGQDAVNISMEFHKKIPITGTVLTMLDGNTRAGAAISIREMTGQPLRFEGIGEKIDDIQLFSPQSMADRILGMGDTINLVRKAQEHVKEEDAKNLQEKILSASFTYNDYLSQIQMVKKMGSFKSLMSMLPGMGQMQNMDFDDGELFKVEAMIQSMTPSERAEKQEMSVPRRRRIAKGSGTKLDDVNKLVKSFKRAKQFFKNMPNMKQMQKMMGGLS